MLLITLVLEDTILHAQVNENGEWEGLCQDLPTGKAERFKWSHTEISDIAALAIAGDDHPERDNLYLRCEKLLTEWDREVRPIP